MEEAHGAGHAQAEERKYWNTARYKLNNAISLIQQALEIELKARIAQVSPYLLIAGDPHTWPKPDKTGQVDFSDFRTLDSLQLCRVCDLVSNSPLPPQFVQLYGNVRKMRNKIAHLNAGNIKAESSEILLVILTAHGHLYGKRTWMAFRRRYILTEQNNGPRFDYSEDYTNDRMNQEFETLCLELEPRYLREFFDYNPNKRALTCFNCQDQRTSWCDRHWEFAQRKRGGIVGCVVCTHQYTQAEYKELENIAAEKLEESERKYGSKSING
jgi:hypothetical protein